MTDENEQDKPDPVFNEPASVPPQVPFAPMPPPREAEQPTPPTPVWVTVSFWIWIAGAALSVIGAIYTIANRNTALAQMRQNAPTGISPQEYETVVNTVVTASAAVAVVFAGLYVFFAYKVRAGRPWARTVLTVLTVVGVLFDLFFGGSASTYLSVLISVIAVGLLYLPSSRAFFAAGRVRP